MRDQLVAIRPAIPQLIIDNETSDVERFQNRTLRPILKFQNELLVTVFRHHLQKWNGSFYPLSRSKQQNYIENTIRKDSSLRNRLLGMVLGHFTVAEWEIYIDCEKECNRRITNMIIQRLQDQIISNE